MLLTVLLTLLWISLGVVPWYFFDKIVRDPDTAVFYALGVVFGPIWGLFILVMIVLLLYDDFKQVRKKKKDQPNYKYY